MADSPPERLYLVHLQSGDTVSAQYNPTEITEAIEVAWKKVGVRGESHEHYEYELTKSPKIEFELGFDTESGRGITLGGSLSASKFFPDSDPQLVRRWLRACCYVPRGASNIKAAAPSRILIVWAGLYSLACRLEKVEFTYRQFEEVDFGQPSLFSAKLTFGVDFDRRLFYEEVLEHGTEIHDPSGNFVG